MGGPAYIDGKKYKEFDNFYVAPFRVYGDEYPTVEHGFQASKNDRPEHRKKILAEPSPKIAWEIGNSVELRDDWEEIKFFVMNDMVERKLYFNPHLVDMLVETEGEIVFKSSSEYWNDTNSKILTHFRNLYKNKQGRK